MKPGSLEWFRWFYEVQPDEPGELDARWHEDAVVNQTPDIPGSAGKYEGHSGILVLFDELSEAYADMVWNPVEVHELGDERYLVLLLVSGRGQASGIPIEGVEVAHIVTLRGERAARIDAHIGWEKGREGAGLG